MATKRHPNKHVAEVIAYAESRGWTFVPSGRSGHPFGTLLCHHSARDGCRLLVFSTPRRPEEHARYLRHRIDACPHGLPSDQRP